MSWYLGADYGKGVVVPKSALDKEQDRQMGVEMAHLLQSKDQSCLGVVWQGHPLFCHLR